MRPAAGQGGSTRVGVISDTHGLLRPEAVDRLAGVDRILHAGDIGRAEVVDGLRRIAPVDAIRGNVDAGAWAAAYPETLTVAIDGRRIHLVHALEWLRIDPASVDVVVSGHSHKPGVATRAGVLYLNPGSAGPRRFRLPVSVAILEVGEDGVQATILDLGAR
ncbi:MAG TPA: metallophosphoesterase family protein [Thalassobaculum sp.]